MKIEDGRDDDATWREDIALRLVSEATRECNIGISTGAGDSPYSTIDWRRIRYDTTPAPQQRQKNHNDTPAPTP